MAPNIGHVLQERYRIDTLLGQGGRGAESGGVDLLFNASVSIEENRMVTPESEWNLIFKGENDATSV